MKRIAYLMGSYPMWSETFIEQELRLLIESALPVLPLAIRRGNRELPKDLMNPLYLEPGSVTRDPSALEITERPGGLTPAFLRRMMAVKKNRELIDNLVGVLEKFRAGHILAAMGDQPALLAAAAAREMGIGYSLSLHAHDVFCQKYDDGFIFDKAEVVLCCNRAATESLLARRPNLDKRLFMVPHGLQVQEWPVVNKRFAPDGAMKFLWIGRMVPKKRPELVLQRVHELARTGMDAEVCMIGDGPLRQSLAEEAAKLDLSVHFQGIVERREVAKFMKWADALLFTSGVTKEGDDEGLPNVILEAMCSGLPVIATETGSTREVLNRTTGVVWDPTEPNVLPKIVKQMLKDPAAVLENMKRARKAVEDNYDARKLMSRRVHLLRNLKGM